MSLYKLNQAIPKGIFRAYDIRGTVEDMLTPDNVYSIGLAIGTTALAKGQKSVVIGRDGRLSGPVLSKALAQGLLDTGCHVIDIGMVPTPLVYFATKTLETQSGVMLTGSHNPINYNGLKIVINGETLAEQDIIELYNRITTNNLTSGNGRIVRIDMVEPYIAYIIKNIKLARPLKIVVDCGSGVAGMLAPRLFRELGCSVTELFCEVDGMFPHHHPDPSKPENLTDLIAKVKAVNADVGLAFDGDADRLGVVTNEGKIIYPDRQIMLFAIDILSRVPGAKIIYDVKSSRHLAPVITQHGGEPILWKTGHSLIKNKMREIDAPFAGEMSGHLFFKERWFGFDDGIYSGVRLLEILAQKKLTSTEVFAQIPEDISTPELNIHMDDDKKFAFVNRLIAEGDFRNGKKITLDGLRVEFAEGWGLVRCSNTTPNLVLRFEANNSDSLQRVKNIFKTELKKLAPDLALDF